MTSGRGSNGGHYRDPMRRLTTLAMVLVLFGGVAGCGSSKPPAPASVAATTVLARSPISRCVRAWNEGAGEKQHMRIAGEAYPSDVATIATYGGTATTYDTLAGAEGANPAAWVTIEPGACIVVASFTIIVQQPDGSWAEPGDTPGYTRYFQPIAANGETWSTEHANVTVSPQHNIALETAGGQTPRPPGAEGKLTVMGGDQAFEMTAQEVAGDSYAEKQKTEAELVEDKTWAREQEQGKQSSTTPTPSTETTEAAPTKSAQETEVCTPVDAKFGECKAGEIVPKHRQ